MTPNQVRNLVAAAVIVAGAGPALAHPGHGDASFAAGVAHPLSGLDHLPAMAAIGAWAGQRGGRAAWVLPVAAVVAVAVGGALGAAQVSLPGAEAGIAISIVVLGALVALAARAPLAAGTLLVATFALLHGHAHGAELPAGASVASYVAGFVLASAALTAAGSLAAWRLVAGGRARLLRGAGVFVALGGIALAVA